MRKQFYIWLSILCLVQTIIGIIICYRFSVNPFKFIIDSTLIFASPLLLVIIINLFYHKRNHENY